jgi:dolichol-phosphate mannosyltransferase
MKSTAVIIPCYNEAEGIQALEQELLALRNSLLSRSYAPKFIFVDDGSQDSTNLLLKSLSSRLENSIVLRHERNRNLGAALKTGIAAAQSSDFIAFLDSDCTYRPEILIELFARLERGADLATVSPYHFAGSVEGVPAWRLFLSKGLSRIYRIITGAKLFTFTAMVRAYKNTALQNTISERDDFSFLTHSLLMALRQGYIVAEVPAVLRQRKYGQSKMRVMKTIVSHLRLITEFCRGRA